MKTILIAIGVIVGLAGALLMHFMPEKKHPEDPKTNFDALLHKAVSEISNESSFSAAEKMKFDHYENNVWPYNKRINNWIKLGVVLAILAALISIVVLFFND